MDDLGEKLAEILNNPESMDKVRRMAENILSGNSDNGIPPENPSVQNQSGNLPDGETLKKIMGITNMLKSGADGKNANLLTALRPHLSEPRQEKLDTAVKILKIIDLFPLLKESGLLNL